LLDTLTLTFLDHSTGLVNDRIIFRDASPSPAAPERKIALKDAFQKCVEDPHAELTLYRWYRDAEVAQPTEEFIHVDPDQFSDDDDTSNMYALDDDEFADHASPTERSALINNSHKEDYGGTE